MGETIGTINVVILSGRVSRPPKRVQNPDGDGYVYVFPLAARDGENLVFPSVVANTLPEFVTYEDGRKLHRQPLVTVVGHVRTRNLTQPLVDELTAQAQRAGAPEAVLAAIQEQLAKLDLEARRVVTEIVAECISEGGKW